MYLLLSVFSQQWTHKSFDCLSHTYWILLFISVGVFTTYEPSRLPANTTGKLVTSLISKIWQLFKLGWLGNWLPYSTYWNTCWILLLNFKRFHNIIVWHKIINRTGIWVPSLIPKVEKIVGARIVGASITKTVELFRVPRGAASELIHTKNVERPSRGKMWQEQQWTKQETSKIGAIDH